MSEPTLHLLDAGSPDLQELIDLFKQVTGREPTEQEIAEAKAELEKD